MVQEFTTNFQVWQKEAKDVRAALIEILMKSLHGRKCEVKIVEDSVIMKYCSDAVILFSRCWYRPQQMSHHHDLNCFFMKMKVDESPL